MGILIIAGLFIFADQNLSGQQPIRESPANKAVEVTVGSAATVEEIAAKAAPAGRSFFVIETEWKNIHPKHKIEKSKLEGKQDRTMGVGGLMGGGTKDAKKVEYVDADVAYVVPSFFDHAYLLADGESYALDKLTEAVPGGIGLNQEFVLPKQGDTKAVRLVYLLPEKARNVAFQFFDYSYGHILIKLKGDLKLAAGAAAAGAGAFGRIKDETIELAATALDFNAGYGGDEAPEGWRYAVVRLSGQSLSASSSTGNIIQIEPTEYIWLATGKGHLYYSIGGSTTDEGYIRFTPGFFQSQEVAFLVPAGEDKFSLGLRVQNRVYALALNAQPPSPAAAAAKHADGETLEIFLFGGRRENGTVVLDLGIRSLVESGIEIQTEPQFILKAGDEDVTFDEDMTERLAHRPPEPFVIPPKTFVRFELAYATGAAPAGLYYRGFESESVLKITGLK